MDIKETLGAIEAILFASGEPVEIYRLAQASETDAERLPSMINLLNERYNDCGSGICITRLESSYQMCTKTEFEPQIKLALETKKSAPLSNAAMEALTVIAYNQPVSKGFVENVRGIDSSAVINNLVEKGLVEEAGRLDIPGKPIVYRTTSVFLRSFGLNSLAELPPLPGYAGIASVSEQEDTSDSEIKND